MAIGLPEKLFVLFCALWRVHQVLHVIEEERLLQIITAESLFMIVFNYRILMTMLLRVLSIFVIFIIMISRFMSLLRLLSLHLPLLSLPEIIIISDDAHESLEHRLLLAGAELIRLLL